MAKIKDTSLKPKIFCRTVHLQYLKPTAPVVGQASVSHVSEPEQFIENALLERTRSENHFVVGQQQKRMSLIQSLYRETKSWRVNARSRKKPPEMWPAIKNYWIPKLENFRVKRLPSTTEIKLLIWGASEHRGSSPGSHPAAPGPVLGIPKILL